ncbi:hypothetical protein ElyMa_000030000 [Elysia marginata]|uniref:Uncharacterized protein n=1 Tax=Elysia marginata TaxID=1093978 RepID=A0AAV4EBT8_9GAST|nr:hypothetical protein ElyMa_000030000 [Elysia marginata]
MASNLCHVSSTWSSDRSPTYVTKFTYLDLTDLNEEGGHPSLQNDRVAEDIESNPQTQIWLTRVMSDEDSKHCIVDLTCPNPEFAQINGIFIVSESRTIEVSSAEKGYLTTLRGKKVVQRSQATSPRSSSVTLYSSFCHFEESYPSLIIKFLSLGDRTSFCVQNIRINMIQHGLQSPTVNGTLNVDRLKKDIEDMGNTMSDRAKDFMTTLEQYEKNKLGKMNSLLGSPLPSYPKGDSDNGLSSIMNSILGAGTMKSLASPNIGSDGDKPDLFSILNSVCGSVANLRVADQKHDEELCETDIECSARTSNTVENMDQHLQNPNVDLFTEKINILKSDLKEELSELRKEMITKVEDVKLELNQKLDTILTLLERLQPVEEIK